METNTSSNSRLKMVLADVMTSIVFTMTPDQTVEEAAKLMKENQVGSIVMQLPSGKKKPLGIITERDIVTRVVAENKDPAKTVLNDIATKPVITAPPTIDIAEAMAFMARVNIRRIIIVEEGNIVGIVTYRDLLRVAPSLLKIALEYEKMSFGNQAKSEIMDFAVEDYDEDSEVDNPDFSLGYYCSECGQWCDGAPLYDADDQLICGDCLEDEK